MTQPHADTPVTHCAAVFLAACQAVRAGIEMVPKSRLDKEYFAQDWFVERLTAIGLPFQQQGRNGYPDFWVGDEHHPPVEGYEVKSLAFARGKPARKDFDSNSTIPSGRRQDRDVFLAFFLYEGTAGSLRTVQSLAVAHTDLINDDHEIAAAHVNESIHGFGSYGDGFIRNRKMYVFPHPFTIDSGGIGRRRLIVPTEWRLEHSRLVRVGALERPVATDSIRGYSVDLLRQGAQCVEKAPSPRAGRIRTFDVFEEAPA